MYIKNRLISFVSHLMWASIYGYSIIWIEYNLSPVLHSRKPGSEFGGQFKRLTSCNLVNI
jgi:hypothetical protein